MDSEEEDDHFGFGCNICGKQIHGCRYHCNRCYDFDLCSRCMVNDMHDEHSDDITKFDTAMDTLTMFLEGLMQANDSDHFITKYKENVKSPKYWTHFHSRKSLQDWNTQNIRLKRDNYKKILLDNTSAEFMEIEEIVMRTWDADLFLKGKDANGLLELNYTQLTVENIERLENPELFEKYAQERARLFNKAAKIGSFKMIEDTGKAHKGPIATTEVVTKEELYTKINEHYLFHGTKHSNIDLIATEGLDCRLSKKAMFGSGVYCAESSTKADQYADTETTRTRDDTKVMLLNRVCLGEIYVEQKHTAVNWKRPPCKKCLKDNCTNPKHNTGNTGFYDSLVNDSKLIFREFVVYSKERCYPEYIIYYNRV